VSEGRNHGFENILVTLVFVVTEPVTYFFTLYMYYSKTLSCSHFCRW